MAYIYDKDGRLVNVVNIVPALQTGTHIATINGVPIFAPEGGNIDVTPLLQAGTHIANIGGKAIYAPNGGGGGESKTHINILTFGNSYACDSMSYVPFILKNYGITCTIYMYIRGAMSLQDLFYEWDMQEMGYALGHETWNNNNYGGYARSVSYIDTREDAHWRQKTYMTPKTLTTYKDWDVITIQQGSGSTVDINQYEPWASKVISLIKAELLKPTPLVYLSMYTRLALDNINANMQTARAVAARYPFDYIVPIGTAVFNGRTNATLKSTSDSGELWADDDVHLQEGIPCYIAACTIVQSLFKKYWNWLSIYGDNTVPDADAIAAWRNPQVHGAPKNVNSGTMLLAQNCAISAINFPWEITTIVEIGDPVDARIRETLQGIELYSNRPNTTVYYTKDDTEPTTSSAPYNGTPIPYFVGNLKFIAYDNHGNHSSVVVYKFNTSYAGTLFKMLLKEMMNTEDKLIGGVATSGSGTLLGISDLRLDESNTKARTIMAQDFTGFINFNILPKPSSDTGQVSVITGDATHKTTVISNAGKDNVTTFTPSTNNSKFTLMVYDPNMIITGTAGGQTDFTLTSKA